MNHPRQAILVTFVGPTEANLNPRFRARCLAGSLVRLCDDDVDIVENAARTAAALCGRLGWDASTLVAGSLPGGKGFVYVSADMGAPPPISRCSICGKPAHPSESNDRDECYSCAPKEG